MLALFKVHGMNVQVHCRREWGVDQVFLFVVFRALRMFFTHRFLNEREVWIRFCGGGLDLKA